MRRDRTPQMKKNLQNKRTFFVVLKSICTFTAGNFENFNKMRTIKLFVGSFIALMTICACSNTKPETQEAAPVVEDTVEVVKEQGTVFLDITLEEALEKAKADGKLVFINFHTKTCGPCRKMEKTVFPTPECGEYINKRFIPIMVDGEDDGVGTSIAKKYQIFIYPTYLILTPDGRKEGEISGAEFDVNKFLDMLRTIMHEL